MPLYEYNCQSCHRTHEIVQKFSDPLVKRCPDCGGSLKKLISSSAFQLKGSGWYKDGYSSPAPAKKSEGPTSGGQGDKKTEPTAPKKEGGDKPAEKKEKN